MRADTQVFRDFFKHFLFKDIDLQVQRVNRVYLFLNFTLNTFHLISFQAVFPKVRVGTQNGNPFLLGRLSAE